MSDVLSRGDSRIAILDGWRALSILLVLCSHWAPMPRALQLNYLAGAAGMAIFFTLSGFLITRLLLQDDRIAPFLIKRLMRILPLAWAATIVLWTWQKPTADQLLANFLFYANLPPAKLIAGGEHFWSLCVEVQFYVLIAMAVLLVGRRAVLALPVLALAVTAFRIVDHQPISIVTWHRIDEILAGASLALVVTQFGWIKDKLADKPWLCLAFGVGLLVSSHPASGGLQYLRPYFSAAAVGASVFSAPRVMTLVFTSTTAAYIARISYALYVIHGMLTATWLGGHDLPKAMRYLLRPVLAAATFALAHMSTFHFEKYWIAWAKRLTSKPRQRPTDPTSA